MRFPSTGRTVAPAKIIFLNQVTGPLFRELAEDVSAAMGPGELLTDQRLLPAGYRPHALSIRSGPAYDRRSTARRLFGWCAYFLVAALRVAQSNRGVTIFIVSNPPFLAWIGWLAHVLRRQRYVVLVYDVYPGLLENFGKIRRDGLIAKTWRWANRLTWGRAACVATVGKYLGANIEAMLGKTSHRPELIIVPNWADGTVITPRRKAENPFALQHDLVEPLVVMYSGNVGNTHDLDSLLMAAEMMRDDRGVRFVIIGGGSRWGQIGEAVAAKNLQNVLLLPLLPEAEIPFSLSTADIAIVALAAGAEGLSVPSKTYSAMAAGSALIAISRGPNELTDMVAETKCGIALPPGDAAVLAAAIRRFQTDPEFLATCRSNARTAMEERFSRRNTGFYVDALSRLTADSPRG